MPVKFVSVTAWQGGLIALSEDGQLWSIQYNFAIAGYTVTQIVAGINAS